MRIPTPVCGLARNDRIGLSTRCAVRPFGRDTSLYTRETLGLRPYEIVSIRRSYDYGAGDGAAEPNNVPAAGVV